MSATPSVASEASSPLPRRNLTLPAGSTGHSPGANLSATLSPNSRFLQQHLPPTFPSSVQPSPDLDVPSPLLSPPPLSQAHVILTPTTQEWRELKEIGRLQGTSLADEGMSSDNESNKGDSSRNSVERPRGEIDYFNVKDKAAEYEESQSAANPKKPVVNTVVTAPSPKDDAPAPQHHASGDSMESNDSTSSKRVPDLILHDDDNSIDDDAPIITVSSPAGFASFGRRDSLRVKNKPADKNTPKTKTKRELEREKLFKMVDEEIAGTPAETPVNSWKVTNIGRGGGLDSRGSSWSLEPDRQLEMDGASDSPVGASMVRAASMPGGGEAGSPIVRHFSNTSNTVPVRPSPLHAASVAGNITLSSNPSSGIPSSSASDIDLASPDVTVEAKPPQATENERFEAIRNYSRSFKSGSRPPSRAGSREHSRRGSQEDTEQVKPRRSARSRDTTRISLVAGRVVQPLAFSAITPLSAADKAKSGHSLQSFSPFRPASPGPAQPKTLLPLLDGVKGDVSVAPSTVAPSECVTPNSEKAGGAGGHGIDDYVIQAEAGKGAYGLVMRARVKGANGEPVGVSQLLAPLTSRTRLLSSILSSRGSWPTAGRSTRCWDRSRLRVRDSLIQH